MLAFGSLAEVFGYRMKDGVAVVVVVGVVAGADVAVAEAVAVAAVEGQLVAGLLQRH